MANFLGLCKVYASKEIIERATQRWTVDELLNALWIVYKDFSMVENQEDKEGALAMRVTTSEKEAWIGLKALRPGQGCMIPIDFNVVTVEFQFAQNIFCKIQETILQRLDKSMLSKQNSFYVDSFGGKLVHVDGAMTFSDHWPIWFVISWGVEMMCMDRMQFTLNVSHLVGEKMSTLKTSMGPSID